MHTTSTTRTLAIDGMTGDLCVQRATGALKSVPDIETSSVTLGTATIHANQKGCDDACAALASAGFTAAWAAPTLANKSATSDVSPNSVCPAATPATSAAPGRPAAPSIADAGADSAPIELAPTNV